MTSRVISFSGRRDGNRSAFARVLPGAPPEVLFLSARRFGKVSIQGDLMDSPEARDAVLRFMDKQEALK